jgi:transposase
MFVRVKPSGRYKYLQLVENTREGKKVKQHVLFTLGRLDQLIDSGKLEGITQSLLRFNETLTVINLHKQNQLKAVRDVSIGPALVFGRLWDELGIPTVINEVAEDRHFGFDLERAVFLTVLHRLFDPGSDRAAEKWREDFHIPGVEEIQLHQLYRAMGWLGESLLPESSPWINPLYQHFTKDRIEQKLFERNRDLFTSLQVVFFDTTSIYFEGNGGESVGAYGHSKDHRPDLKQMVVGVVLDAQGRPICCELLPGNITDSKTLLPVVKKIKQRFGVESFCIVADRGMISKNTIKTLESHFLDLEYIFGCRMRRQKEVHEEVLGARDGEYQEIHIDRAGNSEPLTLKIKEVFIDERRYIICHNPEQAKKDAEDREAIVRSLQEKLKRGDRSLIGNKGYRKYLKPSDPEGVVFEIDEEKIDREAQFDGTWVLRTNTKYTPEEVAVQYKELWMVEQAFRTVKSVLGTRPIYHKCDDTIRGHVFCSFLALVLMKELFSRLLQNKVRHYEWHEIKRDLEALREVELQTEHGGVFLRTELRGVCHDIFQAAGVAIPRRIRT